MRRHGETGVLSKVKHGSVSAHLYLISTVKLVHVLTFAVPPAVEIYTDVDMRTTQ